MSFVAGSKPLEARKIVLEAPANKAPDTFVETHSPAKPPLSDPSGSEASFLA